MSKLNSNQILKSNATLKTQLKEKDSEVDEFLKVIKEKQDEILNLRILDEKVLKLVVQL